MRSTKIETKTSKNEVSNHAFRTIQPCRDIFQVTELAKISTFHPLQSKIQRDNHKEMLTLRYTRGTE